jgi:hypothetical protein
MTAVIETSAEPTTREGQWLSQLIRCKAFINDHGRRPNIRSTDRNEKSSAVWFRHQTEKHRRGTMKPERRAALDEHLPGWSVPPLVNPAKAAARVQELKTYRDAYGKWPSGRATDPAVKDLANWHSNQRMGLGAAKTRDLLNAQVPGWNEGVQETWERTAREIATFRAGNGELPSASSRMPHVKAWGRWISDMRTGRGMTPERTAYLDGVLPGWRTGFGHGHRPAQLSGQL